MIISEIVTIQIASAETPPLSPTLTLRSTTTTVVVGSSKPEDEGQHTGQFQCYASSHLYVPLPLPPLSPAPSREVITQQNRREDTHDRRADVSRLVVGLQSHLVSSVLG
jgi:hypothetical protein